MLLLLACTNAPLDTDTDPSHGEPGTYAIAFEHDATPREAIVYVPSSWEPGSPAVLNFHGFGDTDERHLATADMRELAEADGVVVVYPQGSELDGSAHWNAALPGPDNKSSADDLGFVDALIDNIDASYPLDAERIYATGYSNGGMLSYALACHRSERIAAVAAVSGTMLDSTIDACEAEHPTGVLVLHGTADDVLPYGGGDGATAVSDILAFWTEHNGSSAPPTTDSDSDGGITIEQVAHTDGSARVEHYRYVGGGHVWFDERFQGDDATTLVWEFLMAHDIRGVR